jgi:hypothetical protein
MRPASPHERIDPRPQLYPNGVRRLVRLLIWAADLLLVYVFAAVACARGFADVQVSGVGIVLFAQFVSFLAAALAALGMIGIVWTALPPVLLAADCAAATSSPRP